MSRVCFVGWVFFSPRRICEGFHYNISKKDRISLCKVKFKKECNF